MTLAKPLRVLLVDPSLFTAPYDAALTEGLLSAGVQPNWAVRPTRPGDREELGAEYVDPFFYRTSDRLTNWPRFARALMKGAAHAGGLAQLLWRVIVRKPDIVHFQWAVVPILDALAMTLLRLRSPVVLTVHDTVPFNGERVSWLQRLGFDLPARIADAVIVHTGAGKDTLVRRGLASNKIYVIPHGPLKLSASPGARATTRADPRWTFVLFGELKPYKGVDVLVEAVGTLSASTRSHARIIVAGRPRMDLKAIRARIHDLGLSATIELRDRRLSEPEMVDLFADADCFVFPYRQVDASGVYFLTRSLGKWTIASKIGVFADELSEQDGKLIEPGDVHALSEAIAHAILERPRPRPSLDFPVTWKAIGAATRVAYTEVLAHQCVVGTDVSRTAPWRSSDNESPWT